MEIYMENSEADFMKEMVFEPDLSNIKLLGYFNHQFAGSQHYRETFEGKQ